MANVIQIKRSVATAAIPVLAPGEWGMTEVGPAIELGQSGAKPNISIPLTGVTLNDTLTSTSTTEGATANAAKQLKDLIDGLGTVHEAADIAGRDALAAGGTADYLHLVHVLDDGDGKWARYQNLGTAAVPAWVKVADEDALAAGLVATNLGTTPSPTNVVVTNTSGNDATLPLADGTNAGLLAPADKTKLDAYAADPVDTYLELTDSPGTYTASTFVMVNAAGNALEHVTTIDGGTF